MTRNDLTTATLAALRIYLKGANTYTGHSRDNANDLRAHALVTFDAANPAPIAVPVDAAPRCPMTDRKLSSKQLAVHAQTIELIAAAPVNMATFAAITGNPAALRRYHSPSGWQVGDANSQPSMWNPWFVAAVRIGYASSWGEGRTVSFTQLTAEQVTDQQVAYQQALVAYRAAQAVRRTNKPAVPVSIVKARTQMVNAKTVLKLAAAVAGATADVNGCVVLTADALALAGVAASWANTSNAHLTDAAHVRARTLSLVGFTGSTTRGTLTLIPIVATQAAVAVA